MRSARPGERSGSGKPGGVGAKRCAIYTRKSSEEGLEQDFNSLHAQREACEAYITSQRHEGWSLVPTHYDDGGYSGGSMDRPGLAALMADAEAGRIDIVVVYKVDRLTRSLADFAKIVERFDAKGISFVSVTQAFNTTSSMGRLTLNVLLSFAQFEREVTAERIRDKLAASKAKGMWMGGIAPLGYRGDGRSLAIVEDHAALVREIYARYLKLGNVRDLSAWLKGKDLRVPERTAGTGRAYGGGAFTRGQLYSILKSPIYVGDIPHRDQVYPGNHPALIERKVWDKVQRQLAGNVRGARGNRVVKPGSVNPLAGRIFDDAGEPLLGVHTTKKGRRYRYYVSKALHLGEIAPGQGGIRLPAGEIEQVVAAELKKLLERPAELIDRAGLAPPPDKLATMAGLCQEVAGDLEQGLSAFCVWIEQVIVFEDRVEVVICAAAFAKSLGVPLNSAAPASFVMSCEGRMTRTGMAVRLVQPNGALAAGDGPNAQILRLLIKARSWWAVIAEGELAPTELAAREGVTHSYLVRVARLAFLSPQVVEGILAGRLRSGVDTRVLLQSGAIPLEWEKQEKRLLAG